MAFQKTTYCYLSFHREGLMGTEWFSIEWMSSGQRELLVESTYLLRIWCDHRPFPHGCSVTVGNQVLPQPNFSNSAPATTSSPVTKWDTFPLSPQVNTLYKSPGHHCLLSTPLFLLSMLRGGLPPPHKSLAWGLLHSMISVAFLGQDLPRCSSTTKP